MKLQKEFYSKLDDDKMKINRNKNLIPMDTFLSFLTIPVERSHSHLGDTNGWTRLDNKDNKLIICGGNVSGVEYLDNIQFGEKLDNIYNNFVNPFYLFDILSRDGKQFFIEYYRDDISAIMKSHEDNVIFLTKKLMLAEELKNEIINEVKSMNA
jgi:hypothetical protein